jgi:glycosyltransferase involved in cell wall biosynthesis
VMGKDTLEQCEFGAWKVQRANSGNGLPGWPRVGMLHSFYRSGTPSGENIAVQSQFEMLAAHGVDVALVGVYSDSAVSGLSQKITTGISVARGTGLSPPVEIDMEAFDVLHVHNAFPNISHRWLAQVSVPTVATIHNYRAFCAVGTFTRDGERCFECAEDSPWKSVTHACYRDSRIATLPIAIQQSGSSSWSNYLRSLKVTVVPGEPMRGILQDLGIHNSVTLPQPAGNEDTVKLRSLELEDEWLFVGRLDSDKGISELLTIWPQSEKLVVVGSGPNETQCMDLIATRSLNVEMLGSQDREVVAKHMATSLGLVFPSKALEGAPLVYGEAMSVGLPVLAAQGNVLADQVNLDGTGGTFSLSNSESLLLGLDLIKQQREQFSRQCVETHESRYTTLQWLEGVLATYKSVLS